MDRAYVAVHMEEDRAHWWFRGRRAVLVALLRRRLPAGRHRLLELGCGTGNMLEAVRRLRARDASKVGKTEKRRGVANNQVVIAGTRIPVRSVKAFAEACCVGATVCGGTLDG